MYVCVHDHMCACVHVLCACVVCMTVCVHGRMCAWPYVCMTGMCACVVCMRVCVLVYDRMCACVSCVHEVYVCMCCEHVLCTVHGLWFCIVYMLCLLVGGLTCGLS